MMTTRLNSSTAPAWRCPSCRFSCDPLCLATHQDCRRLVQRPRGHHRFVLGEPNPDPLDLDVDQLQQDGAQEPWPTPVGMRRFPGE